MLTKVILEGPLGKQFGREWELAAKSPREAISLIDANCPGVFNWMRSNAKKYSKYVVVCKTGDRIEEFSEDQYQHQEGRFDEIRFVPVIEGAGNVARIVVGVIMIVIGYSFPVLAPYLYPMGAALILGGVAGMLAPKPKMNDSSGQGVADNRSSYYFDGPANTTAQGAPVPLIYGRCMVGSQTISAAVTVDQLM